MLGYLPWLFLLACPMMRAGVGGGGASMGSAAGPIAGERTAPGQLVLLRAGEADARIVRLDREFAALNATGRSAPADLAAAGWGGS